MDENDGSESNGASDCTRGPPAANVETCRDWTLGGRRKQPVHSAIDSSPTSRFSELEERLKELVAAGQPRRDSYDEVPPRVEYEPTEKDRAVLPAFGHLHAWAIECDLEPVED